MNTLSNDFGHGNIKSWSKSGGTVIANHTALAKGAQRYEDVYEDGSSPIQLVEFNGAQIYAGEGAYRYGRSLGDLSYGRITEGTDEMRAVLYAAWADHFGTPRKAKGEYSLCVQLPVDLMRAGATAETKAKLESWLVGEHSWLSWDQPYSLTISSVSLQSQAGAAVYDHIFTNAGAINEKNLDLLNGQVGIVSIGYKTVELMVLDHGAPMHQLTSSETVGVSELLAMMDGGKRGLHRTDTMLRQGTLSPNGSMPAWAAQVRAAITQRWAAELGNFDAIIMVGGGSIYLKEHLRPLFQCKVVTPDDPILSIARGGYKKGMSDGTTQEEG